MGQWLEDPNEPSGWRYDPDAPDGDPTVTHILPEVAPSYPDPGPSQADVVDVHAQAALEQTGYVYTDPVDDPDWPHITEPDNDAMPDAFPPGWGQAPTERDQAAIDAGNA